MLVRADPTAIRGRRFKFVVAGKEVCRPVWLLCTGVSPKLVDRCCDRIRDNPDNPYYYDDFDRLPAKTHLKCRTIAWMFAYANTNGDLMPNEDKIRIPRVEKKHLFEEFKSDMSAKGEHAGVYETF